MPIDLNESQTSKRKPPGASRPPGRRHRRSWQRKADRLGVSLVLVTSFVSVAWWVAFALDVEAWAKRSTLGWALAFAIGLTLAHHMVAWWRGSR